MNDKDNKELEKEVKGTIGGDNPFYLNVRDTLNKQGCGMCLVKMDTSYTSLTVGTYTFLSTT